MTPLNLPSTALPTFTPVADGRNTGSRLAVGAIHWTLMYPTFNRPAMQDLPMDSGQDVTR